MQHLQNVINLLRVLYLHIRGVLKMLAQRIFALLMLVIPTLIAMVGWKWMKDSFFVYLAGEGLPLLKLLGGLILFLGGVIFVAGFIFHRDKKRKLLQPRFLKKKRKH